MDAPALEQTEKLPIGLALIISIFTLSITGIFFTGILQQSFVFGTIAYTGPVVMIFSALVCILFGTMIYGLLKKTSWAVSLFILCEVIMIIYALSMIISIVQYPSEYMDTMMKNIPTKAIEHAFNNASEKKMPADYFESIMVIVRSGLGYTFLLSHIIGIALALWAMAYVIRLSHYFKKA